MSFNQNSSEDTAGVGNDSFFAISPLQCMSRRHIMRLSAQVAAIAGSASSSLLGRASTDRAMLKQEKNLSTTLMVHLEDWHCSVIEFPEHYYFDCTHSELPIGATA